LGDGVGEPGDSLFAGLDKCFDAEGLDISLGLEPKLPLHFDLNPETLTVEAVLPIGGEPPHGLVTQKHVFESASPYMVHS
jgi:hypothetical protein